MDSIKIAHNTVLQFEQCSNFFQSCLPEYANKQLYCTVHRWYFPMVHAAIDCFAKIFGKI
jgi:hypothetical protein